MTTPSQPTLLFKKTLRVVREVVIDYEMNYDEFITNNMDQLPDEDDKEFAARCLAVWEALVDQQENKTRLRPAYVELGEHEQEEDWDDWDGEPGEECMDDITELIYAENKEFPKWVAAEAAAKKLREERAAIELAEWKARQEQMKAQSTLLEQKQRVAELEAKEAAQAARIAALRAELAALQKAV